LLIPWSLTIPDALRATEKDVNIAQYRALTIPDALRATEKTVSFNTRYREPELPILVYSIFGPVYQTSIDSKGTRCVQSPTEVQLLKDTITIDNGRPSLLVQWQQLRSVRFKVQHLKVTVARILVCMLN